MMTVTHVLKCLCEDFPADILAAFTSVCNVQMDVPLNSFLQDFCSVVESKVELKVCFLFWAGLLKSGLDQQNVDVGEMLDSERCLQATFC